MNKTIQHSIEQVMGCSVDNTKELGGGCIANANIIRLSDGREYFCKSGTQADSFKKEANGLKELAKSKTIRIPEVIDVNEQFLLLEYIKPGPRVTNFFEILGLQLAKMHRFTSREYGFFEDNYIGASVQHNVGRGQDKENWCSFYFNQRLLPQLHLAISKGYDDGTLRKLFGKLESKITDIVIDDEAPSLLHGDLWGGNYLSDQQGQPVLIDPAVYYGHREADLAMTSLFGGFGSDFYAAYQAAFPLNDGWKEREPIYQLYHLMNHLNLFGRSYYSSVLTILKHYVG